MMPGFAELIVARAMPLVLTNIPIPVFWWANTCSTRDRIFERLPLARAVASLIGRPFGFL
ncbi:hypothetical protein WKW50_25625 [Ochrobactrum sp. GPK 3]